MAGTAPEQGKSGSSSGSKSGSKSSSSSGGGYKPKKSNDKPQRDALKKLLATGFAAQLKTDLSTINSSYVASQGVLTKSYNEGTKSLTAAKEGNDKAEAGSTQANLGNRAREAGDILSNAAEQGAGETDTLRAKNMALNNWSANQAEVSRSFHDTQASNNAATSRLNSETYESQHNLANQMLTDLQTRTMNSYAQRADAATQLGNLQSNPYSNAYSDKGAKAAYKEMQKWASATWKNPGIDKKVSGWQGSLKPSNENLNSSVITEAPASEAPKKPEGTTLNAWG